MNKEQSENREDRNGGVEMAHQWYRLLIIISMVVVFGCGTALAQTLPSIQITGATIFEGNSGTSILKLPLTFSGPQPLTVTGTVSATPASGSSFNTPIGAAQCGPGVDFESFSNVPFSIPPNTPNGMLSINITICGDTTIEPDEQIIVSLNNVTNALCSGIETCIGVGDIVNDDGPPAISISNIGVSTSPGFRRVVDFTVGLHHPTSVPVSVHFATQDGTAKALNIQGFGSYMATSGTLTIPAGSLSGTIPVTVLGTGGGTFFMNLSSPVNGTIIDSQGECTITIFQLPLPVGNFQVSPDDARIRPGAPVNYAVTWTVPDGEVWRNLNTIDFRLREGNHTGMWLRWNESANTLSLCDNVQKSGVGNEDDSSANVVCEPPAVIGDPVALTTPIGTVFLAGSSAIGSGPTGPDVVLNLFISFGSQAAGHLYKVELAATDDLGNSDDFVQATTVHIEQPEN